MSGSAGSMGLQAGVGIFVRYDGKHGQIGVAAQTGMMHPGRDWNFNAGLTGGYDWMTRNSFLNGTGSLGYGNTAAAHGSIVGGFGTAGTSYSQSVRGNVAFSATLPGITTLSATGDVLRDGRNSTQDLGFRVSGLGLPNGDAWEAAATRRQESDQPIQNWFGSSGRLSLPRQQGRLSWDVQGQAGDKPGSLALDGVFHADGKHMVKPDEPTRPWALDSALYIRPDQPTTGFLKGDLQDSPLFGGAQGNGRFEYRKTPDGIIVDAEAHLNRNGPRVQVDMDSYFRKTGQGKPVITTEGSAATANPLERFLQRHVDPSLGPGDPLGIRWRKPGGEGVRFAPYNQPWSGPAKPDALPAFEKPKASVFQTPESRPAARLGTIRPATSEAEPAPRVIPNFKEDAPVPIPPITETRSKPELLPPIKSPEQEPQTPPPPNT